MNLFSHKTKQRNNPFQSKHIAIVALILSALFFSQASIGRAQEPEGDKNAKPKNNQGANKPKDNKTPTPPPNKDAGQSIGVVVKNTIKPFAFAECGSVLWPVFFELTQPSKIGGYIVQEIEVKVEFQYCDFKVTEKKTVHFWEAWRVEPGMKIPSDRSPKDFYDILIENERGTLYPAGVLSKKETFKGDDFWKRNNPGHYLTPNNAYGLQKTKGHVTITGWVKFYEGVKLPKTFKKK